MLDAAKIIDYIKKFLKQKLLSSKFLTKNSVDACLSPPWVELGGPKDCLVFEIL